MALVAPPGAAYVVHTRLGDLHSNSPRPHVQPRVRTCLPEIIDAARTPLCECG
jgi:hypothetical protein